MRSKLQISSVNSLSEIWYRIRMDGYLWNKQTYSGVSNNRTVWNKCTGQGIFPKLRNIQGWTVTVLFSTDLNGATKGAMAPGGQIMPTTLLLGPPDFQTLLRPWITLHTSLKGVSRKFHNCLPLLVCCKYQFRNNRGIPLQSTFHQIRHSSPDLRKNIENNPAIFPFYVSMKIRTGSRNLI